MNLPAAPGSPSRSSMMLTMHSGVASSLHHLNLAAAAAPSVVDSCTRNNNTMDTNVLFERFDQVIDTLEEKVKKYYYIARETVPDIVATETDPIKFLWASKGELTAAAKRMAHYWLNRHLFFGDRWLLPMTQTGTGCLSRQDVELLRTGYISLVTLPDEQQVFIVDASRVDERADATLRERLMYYYSTTVLNEKTRRQGVDAAVLVNPCGFVGDGGRYAEMMNLLYMSLPMILKGLTTIPVPMEEGRERLIEYFSFLCAKTHQNLSPTTLAGCSIPSSTEEALQSLEARGIPRFLLPEKVGGSGYYESQFQEWIRMRISVEDAMSAALPERNLLPTLEFSKPDHTEKGLSQIIKRPSGAKLDVMSKQCYIRKRNAMYARRRAHKIKIQQVALEDRREILENDNKRLKHENERLELQLARARVQASFASAMGSSNSPVAGPTTSSCGQGTSCFALAASRESDYTLGAPAFVGAPPPPPPLSSPL